MKMFIRNLYKKGASLKNYLLNYIYIKRVENAHLKALAKLKDKETLRCVFFVLESSIWKYEKIYRIMVENKRFDPILLICPIVNYRKEDMINVMNQSYNFFKQRNYNVIKAYDVNTNNFIDVKRELHPDIIFYTNPYKGLIDDRYYITRFLDVLTVYVPYFMNQAASVMLSSNQLLHNLVWRNYLEYDFDKQLSERYSKRCGINTVVTGYPGIEYLIDHLYVPKSNPWKIKETGLKRIIWAPHHTINKSQYGHTCFLDYCDFMLKMVDKYIDKVQFVFKPHPILKRNLNLLWGAKKTSDYYDEWNKKENACISENDYIDLFITSDAMIHDSGSFVIEYLFVNKPVMRTLNDVPLSTQFNEFGMECLEQYYMAHTEQDIEQFIQNVINDIDPLKEQRTKFVNEVLMPKGSPSQNIIDDILDSIDNQILYRN